MKEIKIGNGGAGIVGFVKYMYTKFNEIKGTAYNFKWITSDTQETLKGLSNATLDIGWPYGIKRVCAAYKKETKNWTEPSYIFRDHFALVGPKTNCAGLPFLPGDHPHVSNEGVNSMFKTISEGKNGTKFLTRNDQSATNVLEREIFKTVLGRYPNVSEDTWYIPLTGASHYPDAALKKSNEKGYYTLSDRGIWTWADLTKKTHLIVFCEGGDSNPDDVLLNPCLAIALNNDSKEAIEFYNWLSGQGQDFIESYKLNNDRLYSKAPSNDPYPCKSR